MKKVVVMLFFPLESHSLIYTPSEPDAVGAEISLSGPDSRKLMHIGTCIKTMREGKILNEGNLLDVQVTPERVNRNIEKALGRVYRIICKRRFV